MPEDIVAPIVEAIRERHGSRIRAIDMSSFPLTMEMFLVCSAESRVQAQAIAQHVQDTARDMGVHLHHREGFEEGVWILLDFGSLVVHVFLPETREYYNLEMLWSDAPFEDFPDEPEEPADDA